MTNQPTRWEYRVEGQIVGKYWDAMLELHLKPLGEQGWELVHISERPAVSDEDRHLKAYFKRPADWDGRGRQ